MSVKLWLKDVSDNIKHSHDNHYTIKPPYSFVNIMGQVRSNQHLISNIKSLFISQLFTKFGVLFLPFFFIKGFLLSIQIKVCLRKD